MMLTQALLTALLSGVFSSVILFALTEQRERVERKLTRIEDAIQAYEDWRLCAEDYVSTHWLYGTGTTFDEANTIVQTAEQKLKQAQRRSITLIRIYMPQHTDALGIILEPLSRFYKPAAEIKKASLARKIPSREDFKMLADTSLEFVPAIAAIDRMYDDARALVDRPLILQSLRAKLPLKL